MVSARRLVDPDDRMGVMELSFYALLSGGLVCLVVFEDYLGRYERSLGRDLS